MSDCRFGVSPVNYPDPDWCGEDNGNLCGVINHPTIFYIGMVAAKMFSVFDT